MTRKAHAHKAKVKWWEHHDYKNAKTAVDDLIPKKIRIIEGAVQDMSSDGKWKRQQCLDHNHEVIKDQLAIIQRKFDYIKNGLEEHGHDYHYFLRFIVLAFMGLCWFPPYHLVLVSQGHERDAHHWKKWVELKRLTRTDWESQLRGVPLEMLREFREKYFPSFGLPSKRAKKPRVMSPRVEKAVDGTGRLPVSPAIEKMERDEEVDRQTSLGSDEHGNVSDADDESDSFGPFDDEPASRPTSNGPEGDVCDSDASMQDASLDSLPAFEDLKTPGKSRIEEGRLDSPSEEEYQEAFPFHGPISLDRMTNSLGRKRKTSVDAVERSNEAPSAPLSRPPKSSPPLSSRRMKRIKISSSTESTGREPSEELGNFDAYASNLTPVIGPHISRAMDSSSPDAPPPRGHTFSASPCPQPRWTPHPAGNHTGSLQPQARAVRPSTDDPPVSDGREEDDGYSSDVVLISSRQRKPDELKSMRGSGGHATSGQSLASDYRRLAVSFPRPVSRHPGDTGSQSSSDGKPSRPGSLIPTKDSQSGRPVRAMPSSLDLTEIREVDMELTMDLIKAMKDELRNRPDNPAWFNEWSLRLAFSKKRLDVYQDSFQRTV